MGSKLLILGIVTGLAVLAWPAPASAQDMVDGAEPIDEGGPPGGEVEIGVDYYQPEYYQNYPVYYDDAGLPFYYVAGVRRYVPRTYARFGYLTNYYRMHRHNYRRWYRARGHRYHGYRRGIRVGVGGVAVDFTPLYYDGYTVFYTDAGLPYYYEGDRIVYIPRSHPRFSYYRRHYTQYRPRYRTWYRHHGRTFARRRGGPAVHVRGPGGAVHVGPRGGVHVRGPGGSVHVRGGGGSVHVRGGGAVHGGGGVDCRRNPGHPACRRGGGPAVRGGHRGGPAPGDSRGRGPRRGRGHP